MQTEVGIQAFSFQDLSVSCKNGHINSQGFFSELGTWREGGNPTCVLCLPTAEYILHRDWPHRHLLTLGDKALPASSEYTSLNIYAVPRSLQPCSQLFILNNLITHSRDEELKLRLASPQHRAQGHGCMAGNLLCVWPLCLLVSFFRGFFQVRIQTPVGPLNAPSPKHRARPATC